MANSGSPLPSRGHVPSMRPIVLLISLSATSLSAQQAERYSIPEDELAIYNLAGEGRTLSSAEMVDLLADLVERDPARPLSETQIETQRQQLYGDWFTEAKSKAQITPAFAQQSTLDSVRSKGYVQCGVNTGVAGFSAPDANNVWSGLEVDFCRAMAAAISFFKRAFCAKPKR